MRVLILVAMLIAAGCGSTERAAAQGGAPVATPPPNADGQTPAFAGQTRAPEMLSGVTLNKEVIASGLSHPWALEFLPDGAVLVTERSGRLRVITAAGAMSEPVAGLPAVYTSNQGGLLDVALSPNFASDHLIYWSYSEPRGGDTNATAVARGRLSDDRRRVDNVQVIFRQEPPWRSRMHFGSRLVFDREGRLYVTLGERSVPDARVFAQDVSTTIGKVVRINADGTIPSDNPYVGRANARAEIWSYGHRNVQGATLHPDTGVLWTIEHGPQGGDEINVPQPGRNYGWPIITYGEDYSGAPDR